MKIYCCGCDHTVEARLTNGKEIYPHRQDLYVLPFWKCDSCKNYVGCHHKTKSCNSPLGDIPTPELRTVRNQIHQILDPLWKTGFMSRDKVYSEVAKFLGVKEYHTARVRSVNEANKIIAALKKWREVA